MLSAGADSNATSRRALEELCGLYWRPLYYFIRRRGKTVHEAEDLLQGFFIHLLEKETLSRADRERGRFRSFLLGCLKQYLANEWAKNQTRKRGGGLASISLDVESTERIYALEVRDAWTPEKTFERRWVRTLLELTVSRLRQQYENRRPRVLFDRLEGRLTRDSNQPSYREIAEELGMTEGSVKVAAHEMRRRYGEILREEIAQTVTTVEEIDQEIRDLFAVFDG